LLWYFAFNKITSLINIFKKFLYVSSFSLSHFFEKHSLFFICCSRNIPFYRYLTLRNNRFFRFVQGTFTFFAIRHSCSRNIHFLHYSLSCPRNIRFSSILSLRIIFFLILCLRYIDLLRHRCSRHFFFRHPCSRDTHFF